MSAAESIRRGNNVPAGPASAPEAAAPTEQQERTSGAWKRAMDFLWGLRHLAAIGLGCVVAPLGGFVFGDMAIVAVGVVCIAYGVWGLIMRMQLPSETKEKQEKIDLLQAFAKELPAADVKFTDWKEAKTCYEKLSKRFEELKAQKAWGYDAECWYDVTIRDIQGDIDLCVKPRSEDAVSVAYINKSLCNHVDRFVKELRDKHVPQSINYQQALMNHREREVQNF